MNEMYEKVKAFTAQIKDEEMDKENTAILILMLDSKDMQDGEGQTSALIKGTVEKLIELLYYTVLKNKDLKPMLIEALKIDILGKVLGGENKQEEESENMPARDASDSEAEAAN